MTTGTLENEFVPTWWLPEGHSQTLWRKFSPVEEVEHKRQRIELDDEDFIDIDWSSVDPKESQGDTIVFFLHGLCGCSRSPYILAMQSLFNA